jgi:hypothetical protein
LSLWTAPKDIVACLPRRLEAMASFSAVLPTLFGCALGTNKNID